MQHKNMRKFRSEKLWRDKTIEMWEKHGSVIHWKRLDDAEYNNQLRLKLLEEAQEVSEAQSRQDLMSELADVFEVIDAICALHGFSRNDTRAAQEKKRAERGGFFERIFVTIVEPPEGSDFEKYCLAQPEKYPEISVDDK